jgi:hypothetical protein
MWTRRFPSLKKEEWMRPIKNVPFLCGADGVVSRRMLSKDTTRSRPLRYLRFY